MGLISWDLAPLSQSTLLAQRSSSQSIYIYTLRLEGPAARDERLQKSRLHWSYPFAALRNGEKMKWQSVDFVMR